MLLSQVNLYSLLKEEGGRGADRRFYFVGGRIRSSLADVVRIEEEIHRLGSEQVLCVLTTTSCFAPRLPDR